MNKDWKELVIARYRCIPSNYIFCIGRWSGSSLNLIKEIMDETSVGKLVVQAEREFLTNIKNGGLPKLVEGDSLLTS